MNKCIICNAPGCGREFSDASWCDEHAEWLAEEVREFPGCLTPDGPDEDGVQSWYLDEAAHDAIVAEFKDANDARSERLAAAFAALDLGGAQ